MVRLALFLSAALLLSSGARAAALPGYLPMPPGMKAVDVDEEAFGEAEFPLANGDRPVQKGRRWSANCLLAGLPEETPPKDVWARIAPALKNGGWTVVTEADGLPLTATLRYQRGGKDTWGRVAIGSPADIHLELVEAGAQAAELVLAPPAAKPEPVKAESGEFPYLRPLPGSTPGAQNREESPFLVAIAGQPEREQVASSMLVKGYSKPGLSNLEFSETYRAALLAAGWTIVDEARGGDAMIVAHYAKGARELWALLHAANGDYVFKVADLGADDLGAKLARDCHVPLQGVLFDFDKATLKPASDGALSRALEALKANAKLAVEVQGHTDNVGNDGYNLELSNARAKSVRDWLVKHGLPAARLTSKGYGRGKPVASNDTPEGRAKNRRVELACRK